ncbi:hypothetical protein JAAARDRAFT_60267 [Jaapia argillacea MUCL 33604]|uniref:Uncharacterized protein n=1 Tax=Jaapia argillacea MUCL 33604 TaxID=933084 RepID=A0A067PWU2_9AGAM|nr:hypothetical protein JAAARDRAFT_60267 [Jaapia argillacea MUCL 33604]
MLSARLTTTLVISSPFAGLAGYYWYQTKYDGLSFHRSAPKVFLESPVYQRVINPNHNQSVSEGLSIKIRASQLKESLNHREEKGGREDDEKIVMALFRGFWSGWIFTMERHLANRFLYDTKLDQGVLHQVALEKHGDALGEFPPPRLLDYKTLPDAFPVVGTVLWNLFTVTDFGKIVSKDDGDRDTITTYIDSAWKLTPNLAGCFRFALSRKAIPQGDDEELMFSLSSQFSDPLQKTLDVPFGTMTFHLVYERLLFGDALRNVVDCKR